MATYDITPIVIGGLFLRFYVPVLIRTARDGVHKRAQEAERVKILEKPMSNTGAIYQEIKRNEALT